VCSSFGTVWVFQAQLVSPFIPPWDRMSFSGFTELWVFTLLWYWLTDPQLFTVPANLHGFATFWSTHNNSAVSCAFWILRCQEFTFIADFGLSFYFISNSFFKFLIQCYWLNSHFSSCRCRSPHYCNSLTVHGPLPFTFRGRGEVVISLKHQSCLPSWLKRARSSSSYYSFSSSFLSIFPSAFFFFLISIIHTQRNLPF
jgi:hypothetical protein